MHCIIIMGLVLCYSIIQLLINESDIDLPVIDLFHGLGANQKGRCGPSLYPNQKGRVWGLRIPDLKIDLHFSF